MKSLAAAVSAVLGVVLPAQAIGATNIATDGRTVTLVHHSGNVYDVTSGTSSKNKRTAFNSFSDFSLDGADTVNLHLPDEAKNLVNLVWNSQAVINGTLNSYIGNANTSTIGGSVFFADPHGVVVGAGAQINVGALSLSAPTGHFMDSLLNGGKVDPDADAVQLLLTGREDQAKATGDACLICIGGSIHANNAVRIRATAIDVSGTIFVSGDGSDVLATAVNVEEQDDPVLVRDGNTIRLVAQDSSHEGIGDAVAAGSIAVEAGASLTTDAKPIDSMLVDAGVSTESWGAIVVSADAVAESAYGNPTTVEALKSAGELLLDQDDFVKRGINATITDANLAASDKLGQLAYVRAFATADVSIGGAINAGGDVVLKSTTTTRATTDATSTGGDGSLPVMITGMYGAVSSKASTTIAGGASVTSGGALRVQSGTDNTLEVSANTVATDSGNVAATTVAWSQAAVDAEASIDGGVIADSLEVGAHNTNRFSTTASATTRETGGSVGLAGAVSLQTVTANAALNGNPHTGGDVMVAAETDTLANRTEATTGTASEEPADEPGQGDSDADLTATLGGKTSTDARGKSSFGDKLPFKLGAAVAWTDSDNAATAAIGNGVTVDTQGNVAIQAIVSDTGIHNAAVSGTTSTADEEAAGGGSGGGGGSSKVNLAAAVSYGNYQHLANAVIGSDADISAASIGVGSRVIVPFDWTFGLAGLASEELDKLGRMGDSLDDFIEGAESIPEAAKGLPGAIVGAASGHASASAGGAAVDIGGSVNYFAMANTDRAWIGDGTRLTSTAAATPGSDSWQSNLDWSQAPTVWDHSISVVANTDVAAFNVVGDIEPWVGGPSGDKAAIGGAFNYGAYENATTAGIGSGVVVNSSNDVQVAATSHDTLVVLSPVSGKGGTASMQGTVALTDVDDHTRATISGSADVTARALSVTANNPIMLWSLSGALAMSNQASVGISIGISNVTTDTLAGIGDNSADEVLVRPGDADAPTPPTGLAESGGTLTVASLTVAGRSSGESGALSVAGSSVSDQKPLKGDGSEDKAPAAGSGSGLLSMLESVASAADKLRESGEKLASVLDGVDELSGSEATSGGSSLLDKASDKLGEISEGDEALQEVIGKATSLKANKNSTKPTGGGKQKGSFGIGISGAASVNLAQFGTRSELAGVTVDNGAAGSEIAIQAIDNAQLMSGAGGIALTRTRGGSKGGDLAGAVAYSRVANTTTSGIDASTLHHARRLAVQALDGSEQVDVGVGVAARMGGSGTSATLAGSVSIGTSGNHTEATITDSTVDGGANQGTARTFEVTAYDHSTIGVGAGSLALNTGTGNSVNGSLAFTYADIGNHTHAAISGHTGDADAYDVKDFDALTVRALDASLIGAGAATGSIGSAGQGLSGAFIWNQIANTTTTEVSDGARLKSGAILLQANAVEAADPGVSDLNATIDAPASASGYDFDGAGLAFTGTGNGNGDSGEDSAQPGSASLAAGGWGSSIIAVAGDVSVGKNNVGLAFVGNQVTNTHQVSVDDADLDAGGVLTMQAQDNTRILGLAVGGGVSTGQFAGMGSATYNKVGNTDAVHLGSSVADGKAASLTAGSIDIDASDASAIFSLAGNVAIGKGNAALGGAVTYNRIDNTVEATAGATAFDSGSGGTSLAASDNATIMSGAVAAGGSKATALMLSFGWNETSNDTLAALAGGSTVAAGSLSVNAGNDATIESLAGSVAIGGTAGVGLAASVDDIGDNTVAVIDSAGLDVAGAATVQAIGTGTQYALAVAGSFGGDGAGAGAVSYNTIGDDDGNSGKTSASARGLYGTNTGGAWDTTAAAHADSILVDAQDSAAISSLALGIGIGGDVGVGAAVGISTIQGSTAASLDDSVLDITSDTQVSAASTSTIKTLSMAGAASGSVAVSGSDTTNIIGNTISASMTDVGTEDGSIGAAVNSTNTTTITASDKSSIASLAGSVAGTGSAAVGAAIAVNQIDTTTRAAFSGGAHDRTYKAGQLVVDAGAANPDGAGAASSANIQTIAVGAAGGGDAGIAGSFAVNLLGGTTDARIDQGAKVITGRNVGVIASNTQGIDVLAGAAAVGGTAGVGVGVAVNRIGATTSAGIHDSQVSAYGRGAALDIDSGTLAHSGALDASLDITGSNPQPDFVANPGAWASPDLSDATAQVHGLAVNASNQQSIATLGLGASVSGTVSINGLVGVNDVGGATTAIIQDSAINQADYVPPSNTGGMATGGGNVQADPNQQIDVRASSHQYEANLVANVSGSGTVAADGAAATNIFDATTTASVIGTTATSQAAGTVAAIASQWSLNAAMGAAISGEVGAAASAAVTLFNAGTHAVVDGGSFQAGSLDVLASNGTRGSQLGGAFGFGAGTAGIAGVALVNVNEVDTTADIRSGATVTSRGAVRVEADSSSKIQGVAVGGAAGLFAGVAGGAAVNVIANRTHATISDSTVTAAELTVQAVDRQSLDVYSGVFGGGFAGVGGGINLSLLQASVGAGVIDSAIVATHGGVKVDASSIRDVTSVAASAGAGAVGVGLSAGVIVAGAGDIDDTDDGNGGKVDARGNLDASGQVNLGGLGDLASGSRVDSDAGNYGLSDDQLDGGTIAAINADGSYDLSDATGGDAVEFGASDGVQATVSGGSLTASQGAVEIGATALNSTSNTAGGFAAGVVAVGGSLAYTALNSDVAASVGKGTAISAGQGVSITASAGDAHTGKPAASTNAIAGSGGLVSVDAAIAVSRIANQVSASDAGALTGTGGALSITAQDDSTASAGNENPSVNIGAIAAGTVLVDALRDSEVSAFIASGTTTLGFDSVAVTASDDGTAIAEGVMGIGGITGAVSGVVANAGDTSKVNSCIGAIGSGANIVCSGGATTVTTTSTGSTSVTASAAPMVTASAKGITIGGALGIGASIATASADTDVAALVGDGTNPGKGDLGVYANLTPVVDATAKGGSGAVMYSGNAAVSSASTGGTLVAGIGNQVTLPDGDVTILAASSTAQSASASGVVAAGILAVGAATSSAESNVTTIASLGDGDNSEAATRGNLAVTAAGQDVNHASSTAGSGGLAAGNASAATTSSTSHTSATVGKNLDLDRLGNFALVATHSAIYGGQANSINAAAVGASGAGVGNTQISTTSTRIGDDTVIKARGDLHVESRSQFASDDHNDGATGGAGGAFVGSAAAVNTNLTAYNTTTLGTGVTLASGLEPLDDTVGNLVILADTRSGGIKDLASLGVYGLATDANAVVNLAGDFTSRVDVGDHSTLSSARRADIATYAQMQGIGNQASATSEGGVGLGLAFATNNLDSDQSVKIGDGVAIRSVGEADVVAGRDILNAADTELNTSAVAQAFVRGLVAIPHAKATSNTSSHSSLDLGAGSSVIAGGDVGIGSTAGSNQKQVDGTGHGYEAGFIPVTQHDDNQHDSSHADTSLDGSVVAGQYSKIVIDIDKDGKLADGGSTSPYDYVQYHADGSSDGSAHEPGGFFNPTAYMNAYSGTSGSEYATGWENTNVGAIIIGGNLAQKNGVVYGNDLLVSGGNAYVYGNSVDGYGSVTANGAPSITINNASPYYLILPGMQTGFGSTGSVIVSGGANPNLPGITVTQAPSNLQPDISVDSSYPFGGGHTPGIAWLNPILNYGGSVTISDAAGSMIENGIVANSVNVSAPNGGITFNHPTENFISGGSSISALSSSHSWLSGFLDSFISNPNKAAAAIANSVYGNGNPLINIALMYHNVAVGGSEQPQRSPVVLYGYCSPKAAGGCSGPVRIFQGEYVPSVDYVQLAQAGTFNTSPEDAGAYNSQTLSVTANYIDINSPIYVGTPSTWTVQTTAALKNWMAKQTGYAPIEVPMNLLETYNVPSSRLIGASYNPATNQIVLDSVNAAGGGTATFVGKVVSTGNGSIHVSSGFGQVLVNNTTGADLVVNNIYTGSGGDGLVTITDKLRSRTTWYVSVDGGPAQIWDDVGKPDATSWNEGRYVGSVDGSTVYQPLPGEQYNWTATTGVTREGGQSYWSWADDAGGSAGQHWKLATAGGTFGNGLAPLGGNDYRVVLSGDFSHFGHPAGTTAGIWYHGCEGGKGSDCNYSTSATGYSAEQDSWHSWWNYIYPDKGTLTLNFVQRADKPIGIAFTSNQTNRVEIHSDADILLDGIISNTNAPTDPGKPDTLLSVTHGGSIVQHSDGALVWTHDLTMTATGGGSIGAADDGNGRGPIQVRIVHDATPGSTLTAVTDGGGIHAGVDSGTNDQAIHAVARGLDANDRPVYGDVDITGTGTLVGIPGHARDVVGRSVALVSTQGGIGTLSRPLNIETHPDSLYNHALTGGTLSAHARGDIALTNLGGDTWVDSIVSDVGNVSLSAPDGGIYDARLLTPATTLSSSQAEAVWARLGLTSDRSAKDIAAALEHQVNHAYVQYWQLLASGAVDGNGAFVLDPGAVALYWPLAAVVNGLDPGSAPDAAVTRAYASSLYEQATSLFSTYVGSDWQSDPEFVSHDSGWAFAIDKSSNFYTDLLHDTRWSTDQLTYAINAAALGAPTGAQVGTVTPNISARNITLTAGAGGIGKTAAPIGIPYALFTWLYQDGSALAQLPGLQHVLEYYAQALAGANTPGDVRLLDANGNALRPGDQDLDKDLAWITIAQTNPLYLEATGKVTGEASGSVFVQADGDLHLGGLVSGTDMRLAATDGIDAAPGMDQAQPVLTAGGDVTLRAGNGSVSFGNGSGPDDPGDALAVQIAGKLLSGAATDDFMLRQLTGDLEIDSVFAGDLVSLNAAGGSILGDPGDPIPGIRAGSIDLDAAGDIGLRRKVSAGVDASLQVEIDPDGLLNAVAGGAVNIASPTAALQVGTIRSNGDLTVTAVADDLDASSLLSDHGAVHASAAGDGSFDAVSAGTGVTLTALGQLDADDVASSTGDIELDAATGMALQSIDAMAGNIVASLTGAGSPHFVLGPQGSMVAAGAISVASSGTLAMDEGSDMAAGGTVTLDSAGDTLLGEVQSTAATGAAISIDSGGLIAGNGDPLNLQARHGGATVLHAEGDIGSAAMPLVVDVSTLSGDSDGGSIWLRGLGDIAISDLEAGAGELHLGIGDTLAYGTLVAGTDAAVAAGDIEGNALTAGGSARLDSVADTTLDTVTTGGDLVAHAGTDLAVNRLDVGRDAFLRAGADLSLLDAANIGRNLAMESGGHLGFAGIQAGGHVFGQSYHGSIDGDTVAAVDWIRFIAAGDLHVASLAAGTDAILEAGANVGTGVVDAGHDVVVKAGGDVAMVHTRAGNAVAVDAGGDLDIGDTSAVHSIALAARRMNFASLQAPDSISLLAREGSIIGAALATRDAFVSARDTIRLDAAEIGDRINLAADTIDAHVKQTTIGQPIYSVLTGFNDGVATRIMVDVDAAEQWAIDRLAALNAQLATTAASAHIEQGHIEETLSLDTADASLRMNQFSAALVPADVQLVQPGHDFLLYQDGMHTFSDAFVVRYRPDFQIQTPNYDLSHRWLNPDYFGESALRYNERTLSAHTGGEDSPSAHAIPAWIRLDPEQLVKPDPSADGTAVNLDKARR